MMKSCRRILIVGFLIYHFGFSAQSLAQDRPLKKINWGMTALSAAMWIPWIAKDAKIYERNGLTSRSFCCAARARVRRRCWAAACSPRRWRCRKSCWRILNGADLVNVAHTIAAASSKLLVKPEIRKPGGSAR